MVGNVFGHGFVSSCPISGVPAKMGTGTLTWEQLHFSSHVFLGACDVTHTAATHIESSVAGPCKDYAAHFLKVGEPQEPGGAVNWRFPKIGGYLFGVPIIRIIVVWALY